MVQHVVDWLDERIDLSGIRHFIAEKGVPIHTQEVWYYLGGMTLFLFAVQVFTGILLLLYYRPSAAEAYESVQFIVTQVEFGWLIRNVHSWSANLLIAARVRALLQRVLPEVVPQAARADVADRHPAAVPDARLRLQRLPAAVERAVVLRHEGGHRHRRGGAARSVRSPVRLLRGGDDVTGATLSRFYGLHVAILPAIATALVARAPAPRPAAGHERAARASNGAGRPASRCAQMPFFPNYILRDVLAWYVVLAVVAALAAFYPWELGRKADAFAPVPPGIRPEWYFLAMFHTLKLVPSHVLGLEGERLGVWGSVSSRLFLVLVPFLDRRASRGERSPVFTALAAARSRVSGRVHDHRVLRQVGAVMLPIARRSLPVLAAMALVAPSRAVAQPAPAANACLDVPCDARRCEAGARRRRSSRERTSTASAALRASIVTAAILPPATRRARTTPRADSRARPPGRRRLRPARAATATPR